MIVHCGKIIGLIFSTWGIYSFLLAYRVIPLSIKDPEKIELWHRKSDKIMKVTGTIGIIGGILMIIGVL